MFISDSSILKVTGLFANFSKSEFGPTVNHEAALVAQSISDITLQQVILIRMKAMLSPNEVTADDYANLFDRVKLEQSQKEVYGTQGQCRGHGTWGISNDDFSIEDLKNLDERRKEIGLDSFSQQQVRLGRFCYVPGGQPFED